MNASSDPQWLDWSKRLQAIAQNGLTYAQDPFDIERFTAVRQIAAEMMASGSGLEPSFIATIFAQQSGYATPKIDMRGVIFRDNRILMVRERSDGKWTLPGGWADPCESPAENVIREIREESGFIARPLRMLAVYDRSKHPHTPPFPFHVYKIFMLCELLGGEETLSHEIDAVGFFEEDNLPELSVGRVTSQQIQRMFEHHRTPDLPTDFDR